MSGQLDHFVLMAKEHLPYAIKRYHDEVDRLLKVLNKRLQRTVRSSSLDLVICGTTHLCNGSRRRRAN